MADIYPSRRWQSFSSLLLRSLCCSHVCWGKATLKFRLLFLPLKFLPPSPYIYFFGHFYEHNSLPWFWNGAWIHPLELSEYGNTWNHWEKKKKEEWLQELGFCSPSALHETIPSNTFHNILLSITLNFPTLLHTTHRTPTTRTRFLMFNKLPFAKLWGLYLVLVWILVGWLFFFLIFYINLTSIWPIIESKINCICLSPCCAFSFLLFVSDISHHNLAWLEFLDASFSLNSAAASPWWLV